jgi:hypothetical protein
MVICTVARLFIECIMLKLLRLRRLFKFYCMVAAADEKS